MHENRERSIAVLFSHPSEIILNARVGRVPPKLLESKVRFGTGRWVKATSSNLLTLDMIHSLLPAIGSTYSRNSKCSAVVNSCQHSTVGWLNQLCDPACSHEEMHFGDATRVMARSMIWLIKHKSATLRVSKDMCLLQSKVLVRIRIKVCLNILASVSSLSERTPQKV
jgi:hypothetical protein